MSGSRAVRLAVALWIALAIVVWNVIFDRVVVVAGRVYVRAAAESARNSGTYLRVDDWMGPAIVHGAWTASAASVLILALGLVAIRVALRRMRAAEREGRWVLPARGVSTEDGEAPGRQGARGENIGNMRDGQRRLPGCIAGPESGDPSR
jgi:hypothetical protein